MEEDVLIKMEVITLSENQKDVLEKAESAIRAGKILAVPTDTVYGFIVDATNEQALARMYSLKERPQERAFPVFVRDISTARQFAYISDVKAQFLKTIWPGPVTMVFHHKEKLPAILTAGRDTIGMRMPNSPFLQALLGCLNVPLAQTSANLSGMSPAVQAQQILTSFDGQKQKPDFVIDGGATPGTPSTILDFTTNHPRILRTGIVSKEELESLMIRLVRGG